MKADKLKSAQQESTDSNNLDTINPQEGKKIEKVALEVRGGGTVNNDITFLEKKPARNSPEKREPGGKFAKFVPKKVADEQKTKTLVSKLKSPTAK